MPTDARESKVEHTQWKPNQGKGDDYEQPADGLISFLPDSWVPLGELVRLNKPGFVYFFVPNLFGALQAAILLRTEPIHLALTVLKLLIYAIPVAFINYSWNDYLDSNFDRQVWRTRHRPIARGAISDAEARRINSTLAAICVAGLSFFPRECSVYAIPLAIGACIYPMSKRVTTFPQLVFGIVMGTGVLFGSAAVGVAPLIDCSSATSYWDCLPAITTQEDRAILWLYVANIAWAVCYEIVYSFQDVEYDAQAGVGTITIAIRQNPKPLLWSLAALQTVLFVIAGWQSGNGAWYYALSVGVMALSMIVKLTYVDLTDAESCLWWFSRGALITGGTIASGLLAEYVQKVVV